MIIAQIIKKIMNADHSKLIKKDHDLLSLIELIFQCLHALTSEDL
jgi:hypothetical protein